jgi:hypothetical protein
MNVPACIQLGLIGPSQWLSPIYLDATAVGTASSWSGSYHVLNMADHYDDYVVTSRIIALPIIAGIPAAHPYRRLTAKIRAASVTGNIGECVAALFASRYLNATISDIAHTRPRQPFQRRRAPDYLMRLGPLMPAIFAGVIPSNFAISNPQWWPVESKARNTFAAARAGRRDALRQLTTYWSLLVNSQPAAVGFGIVVTFTYQPPRELRATMFLPRNHAALVEAFEEAGEEIEDAILRSNLYGCGN